MGHVKKDEVSTLNEDNLDVAVNNTINTIMENNRQIFEIYTNMMDDITETKIALKETDAEIKQLIPKVDGAFANIQRLRQELVNASTSFRDDKAKELYDEIERAQRDHQEKANREALLQKHRNQLEQKLKRLEEMGRKARDIMASMGATTTFLTSRLSSFTDRMDELTETTLIDEGIINAHEEERKRISRELHDTVAQGLAAMLFDVRFCKKTLSDNKPETTMQVVCDLEKGVQKCLLDVRKSIFDMRPMSLDDLGLIGAIQELGKNVEEKYGVNVDFSFTGKDSNVAIPTYKEIAIFRIVQESLSNITHHAEATRASVDINVYQGTFNLTITDNGTGFNSDEIIAELKKRGNDHFGVLGMKERAKQIGGEFNITSENIPGKGAKVRFRLAID